MNKERVIEYLVIRSEMKSFALEVWNFIKENFKHKLSFTHPEYDDFYISENWFTIYYRDDRYYNGYQADDIDIPMANVYDGTWKEYLIEDFKNNNC